ncbi:MAG: RDD family protein [Calothrix sp. MO_192.B10]|nr:RDD family protein [Calothrix sp. MO_192.B10]
MTIERVPPQRYPQVGFGRRCMAFAIDFLGVWLVSSTLGSNNIGIQIVPILVFIIFWLILRVIVPYNNHGQSLGRWALDMQVLEAGRNRIPDLPSLLKRETIVGLGALMISIAINNIIRNPTAILLILPLAIECSVALSDTQMRQTMHDRYARTMIISSQRGYSLDVKFKRLVEKLRRNVRQ